MWCRETALVLLLLLLRVEPDSCATLDVFVSFQRGSGGRGVVIDVKPKQRPFLATLCGVYDSYKVCSNDTFSDQWTYSNLYPYMSYDLTLSNSEIHESFNFRTDFGVPFSAVNYSSVKVSPNSIAVRWQPLYPELLHGPPTGYQAVFCQYVSRKSCVLLNFSTNQATFTDLEPLMRYNITIWPYNIDSFGDVLENSRLASTLIARTGVAPVSLAVPIILTASVLILASGLLLYILKQRLFPSKPRHFILIEEDISL